MTGRRIHRNIFRDIAIPSRFIIDVAFGSQESDSGDEEIRSFPIVAMFKYIAGVNQKTIEFFALLAFGFCRNAGHTDAALPLPNLFMGHSSSGTMEKDGSITRLS